MLLEKKFKLGRQNSTFVTHHDDFISDDVTKLVLKDVLAIKDQLCQSFVKFPKQFKCKPKNNRGCSENYRKRRILLRHDDLITLLQLLNISKCTSSPKHWFCIISLHLPKYYRFYGGGGEGALCPSPALGWPKKHSPGRLP